MSGLPIVVDRHDGEDPRRRQLLAVHELRRGLEQFAASCTAVWRALVTLMQSELIRELQELIAALDRRLPQLSRAGEAAIARDAAALKDEALKRLTELERHESLSRS